MGYFYKVIQIRMIRTYNQWERDRSRPLCRYRQHITIASNNTDTEVRPEDFDNLKVFLWPRKIANWGNKREASQTIESRWNSRFTKKVKRIELVLFSKRWRKYIDEWYQVSVSISNTEEFLKDYRDWTIDTKIFKWWKAMWHVIGLKKIWQDICFVNTWAKTNIVKIPRENLEKLAIRRDKESYTYLLVK